MTIKHLVITGGGPYGIVSFGIYEKLLEENFIKRDNIETIYSTSIGCLIAVFMCLKKTNWQEIKEYLLNKPVTDYVKVSIDDIFNLYSKKGVFNGIKIFKNYLEPFFYAEGVTPDVTFKELYELSGIKINFITSDINNNFKEVILNYETCPDTPIHIGVAASASIPLVFYPIQLNDMCLVDGGIVCNYPLYICLKETNCQENEILGIKNNYVNICKVFVNQESSILNYIGAFADKLMNTLDMMHSPEYIQEIPYEISIIIQGEMGIADKEAMIKLFTTKEKRIEFIERGNNIAIDFLKNINENKEKSIDNIENENENENT